MTINISTHKTILFQILKDLYTESSVSPYLGFKGGTAAFMFYGLDRFSVDLDFDLLDEASGDWVFERVTQIVARHGELKERFKKRFNFFWLLSYDNQARNIKVEVNRRQFGSRYEIKTYLGVSMQVMLLEDMFAHKLMALSERLGKTSRDIYDVWYFLKTRSPINKTIVESRSGLTFDQQVLAIIDHLEKMSNRRILDGLGELLTTSQKDWAKAKLREETIALLRLRLGT